MPNHSLPVDSEFFKGELYQQMQDDLRLAGMAQRTVAGYLRSVRQLADYCQCSPDQVNEEQLRQWLLHLKNERQFAYGSLRVAFSGVKFFFTRTGLDGGNQRLTSRFAPLFPKKTSRLSVFACEFEYIHGPLQSPRAEPRRRNVKCLAF